MPALRDNRFTAALRRTMRESRVPGRARRTHPARLSQRHKATCSSPRKGHRRSSSTCSSRTCTCPSRNSHSSRSQGSPCWQRWPTGRGGPAWPRSQSHTWQILLKKDVKKTELMRRQGRINSATPHRAPAPDGRLTSPESHVTRAARRSPRSAAAATPPARRTAPPRTTP